MPAIAPPDKDDEDFAVDETDGGVVDALKAADVDVDGDEDAGEEEDVDEVAVALISAIGSNVKELAEGFAELREE
jgi:hypothetical protein